jgi:hypothetical protein
MCIMAGKRRPGETCQQDPDCEPGTQCFPASCGVSVCLRFCSSDGDCAASGHCNAAIACGATRTTYSTCALACDPTGTATDGCPPGLNCLLFTGEIPDCACRTAGQVGGDGDPCTSAEVCQPGLFCVTHGGERRCRPLCPLDGGGCPAGGTCTRLLDPDFSRFGACLP